MARFKRKHNPFGGKRAITEELPLPAKVQTNELPLPKGRDNFRACALVCTRPPPLCS